KVNIPIKINLVNLSYYRALNQTMREGNYAAPKERCREIKDLTESARHCFFCASNSLLICFPSAVFRVRINGAVSPVMP
uniref:hypothetical protein n=1 Tax=Treponema endosymbiont of Eucomonympha sp. TaxID=1580831 RepID=UPI001E625A5B